MTVAATPATVGKHPCPECGGDLQWNAAKQALVCPYCGTVVPWAAGQAPDPGAGMVENDLQAALSHPDSGRGWGEAPGDERREVQCQSCHAISTFSDGKVAKRCDFCGSPSIIEHQALSEAITPQSLLPFKISDGQMRESLRKWYSSRWFAPNKLKTAALTDTLHGVYLPYWTFDAQVSARWRADAGHHYYETESYRDGQGRLQSRQVQRVRWVPAAGSLEHFFDDELVPGTAGVRPKLLRQIEPFPTLTDLKPYSPEFVRGWTVERYQLDLRQAEKINEQDLLQQMQALCGRQVPGDTYRNLQVDARVQGRTFKHILVPVWLVNYTYGSRNLQVVANGYTGSIAGEQPYSWVKITFAVLGVLLLLMLAALVMGGNAA
ncbi:MAG: zinc ribbon domain-containing protein [Gammaproteobacteria bacterium]|uniref:zinc ribbon domain-containing protein n=1 Tax=Rhodoferax sp. TaxID=50421 RepID=UPI0017CD12CC|nr:zinc ribbon domain-containing protein [Rhodoferax sp.]MBU3899958.1 zinc ribbon domain-containing protein [Gammaproteobacteria bacterium]MBA3056338.1 zinc ribbon domain-containing protein [Rhodoferax sp.]MBU3995978.1 zinc ribbon domain-containing protein [Gammaproteobacteria bacterium]MBU4019224.1 zinc ribbon domain-containing protein [Gammaproteobacteria bacterium]MBU4078942.1 zinc ribbon domain-containing protein [Gammaproteobacteria bacterium]